MNSERLNRVVILLLLLQGAVLRQDLRRGVIMGNQSLVLQRLGRNASGTYYCVATNSEGSAYSNPLRLDIKCECGRIQSGTTERLEGRQ